MFEIREVSNVEATGRGAAYVWAGISAIGSTWLISAIPAILAC